MAKGHRLLVEAAVYEAMRKRWNNSHNRPTPEDGQPHRAPKINTRSAV